MCGIKINKKVKHQKKKEKPRSKEYIGYANVVNQ